MSDVPPTGSSPAPPAPVLPASSAAQSPLPAQQSSIKRDVVSAYAATASKILSWVIVLGLVYRFMGVAEFALLALIRGTIGILNYTTLGLSPAMIRMLSELRATRPQAPNKGLLSYATPDRDVQALYSNGMMIALIGGAVGAAVTLAFGMTFDQFLQVPARLPGHAPFIVGGIGFGTLFRLMSDAPGAVLQGHGRLAHDNYAVALGECFWVLLCLPTVVLPGMLSLNLIAMAYAVAGGSLLVGRDLYASRLVGLSLPSWRLIDGGTIKRLLSFGSLVLFAQLADYLYAPSDYILINLLLGWEPVAVYTPAMTIDSGLLLLVTGLSSVILPRTAIAHTAGEIERVRRYYIWGTLFSASLLLVAAATVWIVAEWIFLLWLGQPMRATQAILPLVLVHTVVGGSSAVGRSILLGMGKVQAFTISVLVAGVMNVLLSYVFVRHLNLGLKGIVLGTIVVVVVRAGLWMPWYVLRTLRREGAPRTTR